MYSEKAIYCGRSLIYNQAMNNPFPPWLESLAFDLNDDFVQPLCPRSGDRIKISFRVWKDAPIRKAFLHLRIDGEYWSKEMSRTREGKAFSTWSIEIGATEPELRFSLIFDSADGYFFVNKAGMARFQQDADGDFVLLTDSRPPLWFTEGATYQIFPDRFFRARKTKGVKTGEYSFDGGTTREMGWKDRPLEYKDGRCLDFYNGDVDGIRKQIPYLLALGIKTLYINPIFAARTIHRYDCIDYFSVEPHMGGNAAFRRLCEEARKAGIRILLDVSINHTGSDHPWAVAARSDPASPEAEFYYRRQDGGLEGWLGVESLPQLNYRSARLRKIMWEGKGSVIRKWLKPPYSIDGWRFDVGNMTALRGADQLGHEVFRGVRKAAKEENPDCLIIGEQWQDGTDYLRGDQWDGLMNYAGCARPLRSFCGERDRYIYGTGPEPIRSEFPLSGSDAAAMIRAYYARMPHLAQHFALNVLNTHDLYRINTFKEICGPDMNRGLLCIQFLLPGSPSVYYGDEVGLDGWPETPEGTRLPMEWDMRKWKKDLVVLYRLLIAMRSSEECLKLGALRILHAGEDCLVVGRFLGDEAVLGLASRSQKALRLELDASLHGIARVTDILTPSEGTNALLQGGKLLIDVGCKGSGIWKAGLEF